MNKALQLLMAAALVTGFAACSSDDDMLTANNFPQDGVVRFNVGVNIPQTRASHSTDGSDVDEFGICITNSANPKYTYTNIQVTGSNITGWTPTQQMLWQNSTQAVDIVAYSPYVKGYFSTSSTTYPVRVEKTQTKDSYKSDFLICKKSGFVPGDAENGLVNGKLNLAFKHALSQLTITVTLGTEFNATELVTTNPITDLKVNGTYNEGTCNFTKKSDFVTATTSDFVTGTPSEPVAVAPFEHENFKAATEKTSNAKATYRCLLIPQTIEKGKFSVSFKLNGEPYTWTSDNAVTLAENTDYTLALTAGKEIVVVGEMVAKPWQPGSTSNVETE